jgi:hypothetical protein
MLHPLLSGSGSGKPKLLDQVRARKGFAHVPGQNRSFARKERAISIY